MRHIIPLLLNIFIKNRTDTFSISRNRLWHDLWMCSSNYLNAGKKEAFQEDSRIDIMEMNSFLMDASAKMKAITQSSIDKLRSSGIILKSGTHLEVTDKRYDRHRMTERESSIIKECERMTEEEFNKTFSSKNERFLYSSTHPEYHRKLQSHLNDGGILKYETVYDFIFDREKAVCAFIQMDKESFHSGEINDLIVRYFECAAKRRYDWHIRKIEKESLECSISAEETKEYRFQNKLYHNNDREAYLNDCKKMVSYFIKR